MSAAVKKGLPPASFLALAFAASQVAGHVDDAVKKGAKTLTGGKRPKMQGDLAKGNFYEPTILGDATIDMKVGLSTFFGS